MAQAGLALETYVGADIVKSLVESNQREFGSDKRRFAHLNLLRDELPRCDAIFCRDCLVHFSDADVARALTNICRSGATFLIATTYPGRGPSINIITGEWQPLDLQAAPFDLPQPVALINEMLKERDGSNSMKSLGVWRIEDLRAALRLAKQ
jgi:hypothetical protein